MDKVTLYDAILDRLTQVIDPETGADVVHMQLVQDIQIDDAGKVSYTFRPSSPLCPIAVPLAVTILQAISEVEGVTGQNITVVDYVEAEQLNQVLHTISRS
jgi:metal-sulfur cluster biosynthetic enzyme